MLGFDIIRCNPRGTEKLLQCPVFVLFAILNIPLRGHGLQSAHFSTQLNTRFYVSIGSLLSLGIGALFVCCLDLSVVFNVDFIELGIPLQDVDL